MFLSETPKTGFVRKEAHFITNYISYVLVQHFCPYLCLPRNQEKIINFFFRSFFILFFEIIFMQQISVKTVQVKIYAMPENITSKDDEEEMHENVILSSILLCFCRLLVNLVFN